MSEHGEPTTPEEIKADIEATRAELAASVEELTARANVPRRVADKVDEVRESARPHNTQILLGAGGAAALLAALLVVRRRRRRS